MSIQSWSVWVRPRAVNAWDFIRLLRVEPFLFLISFQFGLKSTPGYQMITDKICMHWYNTTTMSNYCHDLPSTREDDHDLGLGHYKSSILGDATEFGTYKTYISTPIGIIWALFIGAWIDRYVKGRKLIMLVHCVCSIVESCVSIYLSIKWSTSIYLNLSIDMPSLLLVGGTAGPNIAIYHYITSTTPPKLMAIRFMLFQTLITFGSLIGESLGGFVLVKNPAFHTGEIRNYTVCYLIALGFDILALLSVIFLVNEIIARKQELEIKRNIQENNDDVEQNNELDNIDDDDMSKVDRKTNPIKLLFDFNNIKSMILTIIKKRPNKVRKQLFLLIISLAIIQGEQDGLDNIAAQFYELVYLWTPDWTSYMDSITSMINVACAMIIIPILIKLFNVPDPKMALLGYCLIFSSDILKGSWLSDKAYYISVAIGACGGMAKICTKSHIAKIVGRDEMGKVMSFMLSLETLTPLLFTTIFAYIFKYTIDSYRGAVFQVIAGLLFIPILVMMWIDLFTQPSLMITDDNVNDDVTIISENFNDDVGISPEKVVTHPGHHHIQEENRDNQ